MEIVAVRIKGNEQHKADQDAHIDEQGVRLRCQSALPACYSTPRDREGRTARPAPPDRGEVPRSEPRRDGALAFDGEVLERLGQKSEAVSTPVEAPDFVFCTGCNVPKTPHIALLALDIRMCFGVT